MSDGPLVKLDFAIVCDDVRQESSGKHILVGVYTGDILVSEFPTDIRLAFWVHGYALRVGDAEIELRCKVEFDEGKPYSLNMKGRVGVHQAGGNVELALPIPNQLLSLQSHGVLSLAWRTNNGRWQIILTKRLGLNKSS